MKKFVVPAPDIVTTDQQRVCRSLAVCCSAGKHWFFIPSFEMKNRLA
jgi:hypothetical protein